MDPYLVLLPLADEYIEASRQCPDDTLRRKLIDASCRCLWAAIHNDRTPTQVAVQTRQLLANMLLKETGDREAVENVVAKGIQDASIARLYKEKLELEVLMALVAPKSTSSAALNQGLLEARTLKDERLVYTLQLLRVSRYWRSKNSKEVRELLECLRELQRDQLYAIQMLAFIIEAMHHTRAANFDSAEGCLNRVSDEALDSCPPQYRVMLTMMWAQCAIQRGNANMIRHFRDKLRSLDMQCITAEGSVFITTFGGFKVEIKWLKQQEAQVMCVLLQAVCCIECDFKEAQPLMQRAINLLGDCEPRGMTFERQQQARLKEEVHCVICCYLAHIYFISNRWDEGLAILEKTLAVSSVPKKLQQVIKLLEGSYDQARGWHDEAMRLYDSIREECPKKDDVYIMATINKLLLNNINSETTGEPHTSTTLKKELAELCTNHSSQLIQYAWQMVQSIYDHGDVRQLAAKIKALSNLQLRQISATLFIPLGNADVPAGYQNSSLESYFNSAGDLAKSLHSIMWVRVAAIVRKKRFEELAQIASAQHSTTLYNDLMRRAAGYDEKFLNDRRVLDKLDEVIRPKTKPKHLSR